MPSYDKVLSRIAYLIKTEQPQKELDNLISFQKEVEPSLNDEEALHCVVMSFVKTYQDYTLDLLWSEYLKETAHSESLPEAV